MQSLAGEVGLKMRMVFREDAGARIPVPSMMHLRGQHFAAVVGMSDDGSVKLSDPLLGGDAYLSPKALREESSGYFLIPEGTLPKGYRGAGEEEASKVRGKCKYPLLDGFFTFLLTPRPENPGPGGASGPGSPGTGGGPAPNASSSSSSSPSPPPPTDPCLGMASSAIQLHLAGVTIVDTPVGYGAPRGPGAYFTVRHNHREAGQPGIFPFSNLGQKWTHDWLSYVEDNPTNPAANAYVFVRGGGRETLTGFSGSSYAPHLMSRGVLTRVSSAPIRYERALPDGGIEVFTQSDGSGAFPRRVFLTEARDPQGNSVFLSYDSQLRLVALTDAIGQVTTISYEMPSDQLKITKVTDPFGRSARFEYNDAGQLVRIVDAIGMASSFEYGGGGYVRALTTPYGTTTYRWGHTGTVLGYEPMRWLEVTDPMGSTECTSTVIPRHPGFRA
jgi:YD repeat-containing protein